VRGIAIAVAITNAHTVTRTRRHIAERAESAVAGQRAGAAHRLVLHCRVLGTVHSRAAEQDRSKGGCLRTIGDGSFQAHEWNDGESAARRRGPESAAGSPRWRAGGAGWRPRGAGITPGGACCAAAGSG